MKSIAFIEEGFLGSTLPLAREFCRLGYYVDIYLMKNEIHEPEGCELDYVAPSYGLHELPRYCYITITDYLGNERLRLFAVSLPRPYESVPILRTIRDIDISVRLSRFSSYLDKQNYEFINIVGNYAFTRYRHLVKSIKTRLIVSFHEVWNHNNPSMKPSSFMKETIKSGCDIIVFSKKSYRDIQNFDGIQMEKVHIIPFGLFDSYSTLPVVQIPEILPEKYFLFFGNMLPYKGLTVLRDAVKYLGDKIGNHKIVLAGRGKDPILKDLIDDIRYVPLLRFIKNSELSQLIRNATALICPYLSMSQSGIPQTSFVFCTPVIGSDLEGFKEILSEDCGIIFESGNSKQLADAMLELINSDEKCRRYRSNISKFTTLHPEYNWSTIVQKYLSL